MPPAWRQAKGSGSLPSPVAFCFHKCPMKALCSDFLCSHCPGLQLLVRENENEFLTFCPRKPHDSAFQKSGRSKARGKPLLGGSYWPSGQHHPSPVPPVLGHPLSALCCFLQDQLPVPGGGVAIFTSQGPQGLSLRTHISGFPA